MMDLKDLQYFLAVAQAGTITGAAAKLCMAQPPLSRQMKELEEELGTTLFIRGKEAYPSYGGRDILKAAGRGDSVSDGKTRGQALQNGEPGQADLFPSG